MRLPVLPVLLVGALAVAIAALVLGPRRGPAGGSEPPAPAGGAAAAGGLADRVSPALVERIAARALGKIEAASEEVPVASDITGRIAEILVDEGDAVEAGQPLAHLDETVHRAHLEAAEAAVRAAAARRDRLKAGARPEEIKRARAALEGAEAQASIARDRAGRARKLHAEGIFSRDETDWFLRESEAREAQARAAREDFALAENATRAEDLAASEAELLRAERELAAARAELSKTVLRSPIAGTVVRRNLRAGEAVSSFQVDPVVTLADLTRLRVRAEVDEIDIGRVRLGQRAFVESDAFPGKRLDGKVARLGATMGRKTVKTLDPNEKQDVRVREVLVDLEGARDLPLGLRVSVAFLE